MVLDKVHAAEHNRKNYKQENFESMLILYILRNASILEIEFSDDSNGV